MQRAWLLEVPLGFVGCVNV
uniref:Uncharacterized protein n=1 Tax=Anguilla anguilla TaxID=7936 RepID=A0A0E9QCA9_ANGAN